MELYLFFVLGTAPTLSQWQHAIDQTDFPIRFTVSVDLEKHSGFIPVSMNGQSTGFYFLLENQGNLEQAYPQIAAKNLKRGVVYSLSYARPQECSVAFYAAAALAAHSDVIAYDPQDGEFLSYSDLKAAADECAAEQDR